MKGAIALVALLAVPSHADPARKAVPAKFKKAASELFRQAVEADDKGKKWDAIQLIVPTTKPMNQPTISE